MQSGDFGYNTFYTCVVEVKRAINLSGKGKRKALSSDVGETAQDDEDEGSLPQGRANRVRAGCQPVRRENRQISGSPPGG